MFCFIAVTVVIFLTYHVLEKFIRSLKVKHFGDKHIFITGCDSGFGQKTAIKLDGLGFPVFAGCLTDAGQKYLQENASTRLTTLSLDVTNTKSIHEAYDFIVQRLAQGKGLWAIVNNAGIAGPAAPTEMTPMDGFHKTCAINLFGAIEICKKFLPLLRKTKGRVVNTASIMGRMPIASVAYNISKFGMEAFSDSLRREIYDQGIKVAILEPGFFKTNILAREPLVKSVSGYYNAADEEVQKAYGEDFVKNSLKLIDHHIENASPEVDLVVDAYTHAIVSRFPKTRYVVGWDAILFYAPLSYLPGGFADWVMMTMKKRLETKLK